MFYDNETDVPQLHEDLPNPFTHTHTPNDFYEPNSETMQQLGTGLIIFYRSMLNNRTVFGTYARTKFHFLQTSTALLLMDQNLSRMAYFIVLRTSLKITEAFVVPQESFDTLDVTPDNY